MDVRALSNTRVKPAARLRRGVSCPSARASSSQEIPMLRSQIALLVLSLSVGPAVAQQPAPEPPRTKIEAFQARDGVVIVRGFSKIGELKGMYGTSIEVESKEFTDAGARTKAYGVTVDVKESIRLERSNTSYIDLDEVPSLLTGIDYIAKVDKSITPLEDFQADYKTKGDFKVSTFSRGADVMFAVSSGTIGRVVAYFRMADMPRLRQLIADAKARLDAIKQ